VSAVNPSPGGNQQALLSLHRNRVSTSTVYHLRLRRGTTFVRTSAVARKGRSHESLHFILIVLFTQAVWRQDWAHTQLEKSPRHRESATVKHDGRSVETFVVYPESKDKRLVVVLIHEIFGMSDWIQDLVDQVAAAG
jgi:hypothetical protein